MKSLGSVFAGYKLDVSILVDESIFVMLLRILLPTWSKEAQIGIDLVLIVSWAAPNCVLIFKGVILEIGA